MLSASIVLYKNDEETLLKAITSFLSCELSQKLYLIDNSPSDDLKDLISDVRVEYIFNPSNPGFGAAHNIALRKAVRNNYTYHIILNPDVYFNNDIITSIFDYIERNSNVGMIMPQILNVDGSIQNLPKLLPSPFSLIVRKLKAPRFYYKKFIDKYELRTVDNTMICNVPILSGCFTFVRIDSIKDVGMYDDSYFMYFEDWDLSRRMHKKYKTIYYPKVSVYHEYESGANKNRKLFNVFVNSAIHYFNKWGWFYDKERNEINKKTLSQFK